MADGRGTPGPPGRGQLIQPQVGRMCAVGMRFVIRPIPPAAEVSSTAKNKTKTNRNLAVVSEDWGFQDPRGSVTST